MEVTTTNDTTDLSPPYVPFATILRVLDRMEKEEDTPARVDGSY